MQQVFTYAYKILLSTLILSSSLFGSNTASNSNISKKDTCKNKRMIVFVIDNLKWSDIGNETPNLKKNISKSYIASLSPGRINKVRSPINFYSTFSAGTRTFDHGENTFPTKIGKHKYDLNLKKLYADNIKGTYGASIGTLGNTLKVNDINYALIEKGDNQNSYMMVSDSKGIAKNVYKDLDPEINNILNKTKRSVLFVHLSSISLRSSDTEFNSIIDKFSNDKTEVLILGSHSFVGKDELRVASLNVNNQTGTMLSGTRQRDGLIEISDITPSILDQFCLGDIANIEGNAVTLNKSHDSISKLIRDRIDENNSGLFRSKISSITSKLFVVIGSILLCLSILLRSLKKYRPIILKIISYFSLFTSWMFLSTFFVNIINPDNLLEWFIGLIGVSSIGIIISIWPLKKINNKSYFLFSFFIIMLIVDLFTNNIFQSNAALGYSFIANSRSYGFSNFASAAFSISLIVLMIGFNKRFSKINKISKILNALILLFGLFIIGYPKLGADVGGALSSIPAFIATYLYITKIKINILFTLLAGLICSSLIIIVGYIDYLRPPNKRTHLGRLFNDIKVKGFHSLADVIIRKFSGMLYTFGSTWLLVTLLFITVILILRRYLYINNNVYIPLYILAFFGTFLNDAGILVGATVLILGFSYLMSTNDSIRSKKMLI